MKPESLKEEIERFTLSMLHVLESHDDEKGDSWEDEHVTYLVDRLQEELDELKRAFCNCDPRSVRREAVDVANYAFMIVHNINRLFKGWEHMDEHRAAIEKLFLGPRKENSCNPKT